MVRENPVNAVEKNRQSLLQQERVHYRPPLPSLLQDLSSLHSFSIEETQAHPEEGLRELFPQTLHQPFLSFKKGERKSSPALKVGVVFSGGPAPGGHNVLSGLWDALKQLHGDSQLIGFLGGPQGIVKNQCISLSEETIAPYRNQGGFDLLGSGRTKIESKEQYEAVFRTLEKRDLDGLVIVGGDDSNTNAAFLAEFCLKEGLKTRVIGVPKTIDGDLKNSFIEISFGFDTASKIYSEMIGNLAKDALSAKKYYFFIKMMGRSASHLTLECALQTQINLALIGEEIAEKKQTLKQVVDEMADLICRRAEQQKNYGVILIPEGLLEFIPECQGMMGELNALLLHSSEQKEKEIASKLTPDALRCFQTFPEEIQRQLLLERDAHGNVQLSKIETERLLIALVEKELKNRQQHTLYLGSFSPQPLFYGYEGRSGFPSNFDCQYAYALGQTAALLIAGKATGYLSAIRRLAQPVESWDIWGVPLARLLHFEWRKNKRQAVIKKALVDLKGSLFSLFKEKREEWRLGDLYCCPGPIQFEGSKRLIDSPCLTVLHSLECLNV